MRRQRNADATRGEKSKRETIRLVTKDYVILSQFYPGEELSVDLSEPNLIFTRNCILWIRNTRRLIAPSVLNEMQEGLGFKISFPTFVMLWILMSAYEATWRIELQKWDNKTTPTQGNSRNKSSLASEIQLILMVWKICKDSSLTWLFKYKLC